MKKWYAIDHSAWSMNDSAEAIREWHTASVVAFTSKRERDAHCNGDPFSIPLTRQRALKYVRDINNVQVVK